MAAQFSFFDGIRAVKFVANCPRSFHLLFLTLSTEEDRPTTMQHRPEPAFDDFLDMYVPAWESVMHV